MSSDDLLEVPVDTKLSPNELQMTPPRNMVQCMARLGREQMKFEEALNIWTSIIDFFGSAANVPDNVLLLLHWITPAITPEQIDNLTLSSINVIENLGLNYALTEAQITALADRVREYFAGKKPGDYTYYDLTALRHIMCGFNRSEIAGIHLAAYREPALVTPNPASLAVQDEFFGSPDSWFDSTWGMQGNFGDQVGAGSPQLPIITITEPPPSNDSA